MKLTYFLVIMLWGSPLFCQTGTLLNYEPDRSYQLSIVDSIFERKTSIPQEVLLQILENNEDLAPGWMIYFINRSHEEYNAGKYELAIYSCDETIRSYDVLKNKKPLYEQVLVKAYINKAAAQYELKDYSKSIVNYQKALDYTKKYPYKWKTFITKGIAINHLNLGNDSLALEHSLAATRDTLFMSLARPAGATYLTIGLLYKNYLKDYVRAKEYFIKTVDVGKNTEYKDNLAPAYGNLGNLFFNETSADSTIFYYKKALESTIKFGLGTHDGAWEERLFRESYINAQEGKLAAAEMGLDTLIERLDRKDKISKADKNLMLMSIKTMSSIYGKQGNMRGYEDLLKTSHEFLERFHEKRQLEGIEDLEFQYQSKEKDAAIAQLEENKKQQTTIINQQRTIAIGAGVFLVLFSTTIGLFWRQRKLRDQYEKENLEQSLLRAQMNPHFIGNTMNTIANLVDKKSEQTKPYIHKLSTLFRLVLRNSLQEFVSLEEELITLKSYLELQSNFSKDFDFGFELTGSIDADKVIIPPMIIQPFLENAVIHGFIGKTDRAKLEVKISIKESEGLLYFEIVDNGIGIESGLGPQRLKNHKSLSGDIIKRRLNILKRKFKVNARLTINPTKKGTKVDLYLPYLLDD